MKISMGNNVCGVCFSRRRPKDNSKKDMADINVRYKFIVTVGCVYEADLEERFYFAP
jgi:hypothetical protein